MAELEKIVEKLSSLTLLEAADLSKMLEEKWGVSASAPMMAMPMAGGAAAGAEVVEQTEFDVILASPGAEKIKVIKVIRELVPGLGLKEAKELADTAPKPVKTGVNKEEAAKIKAALEEAGAKVEVK